MSLSEELFHWIEKCLEDLNFQTYRIQIDGGGAKAEGYMGDIVFVAVYGEKDVKEENLHFVVKHGKKSEHLRRNAVFRLSFEREIFMYERVFEVFECFQRERRVENAFSSIPKCYKTFLFDNMEVLILENLRKQEYHLHDRKTPLNFEHVRLVLEEYGKLHALSFALRDQMYEEFEKLTSQFTVNTMKLFMTTEGLRESTNQACTQTVEILKETENLDLYENFRKTIEKGGADLLIELIGSNESQAVVIHGDCWNSNYMFRYKETSQNTPSKIALLDWQVSWIHSPAYDLSYLLFSSCSKEVFERFDEALEVYYTSFSNHMSALGSDPQKHFSFEDLKRHWKKYSLIGVLFAVTFMQNILCEEGEVTAVEDVKSDFGDVFGVQTKNRQLLKDRLVPIIKCYYQNLI